MIHLCSQGARKKCIKCALPIVPKNYNPTSSINIFRNCELIWKCLRITKLQLPASQRKPHPIWVSSHKKVRNFVRHVISPFHPSLDRKETHTTQWTLNSTLLLNGLCRCIYTCTYLRWKELMTYLTTIPKYFFVTTEPNQTGVLPKCR